MREPVILPSFRQTCCKCDAYLAESLFQACSGVDSMQIAEMIFQTYSGI